MRGGMNHLALTVSNLRMSEERFYAPVLGFLGYQRIEAQDGMSVWLNAHATPIGTAMNLWQSADDLKEQPHRRYAPGFHHFAFAAESRADIDALHGFLTERGITVLDEPAEYDYAPGYYAVFFEDPDGMKFEFVHMPAPGEEA